jgi:hypothetical protein
LRSRLFLSSFFFPLLDEIDENSRCLSKFIFLEKIEM